MGEVVDRVALHHGLELPRGLRVAPAVEVGAPERLANRALLGRHAGGLRERHRGLREVAGLEQGHALSIQRVESVARFGHGSKCTGGLRSRVLGSASDRVHAVEDRVGHLLLGGQAEPAARPPRSTITTSFSSESKPISARETSLKTIASSPFRSSFARARSIASAPCSAAKPTSVWSSLRSDASSASTSSVCSRRSSKPPLPSREIFPASASSRPEVRHRGGHQQHVAGGELLPQGRRQLARGLDVDHVAPRLAQRATTFAATRVTSAPRRLARSASASPIRPLERLPMKRTESIGSRFRQR